MRLRRFVPILTAGIALFFVQTLPAQQTQEEQAPTKAEKKAKKKARKAAEENPAMKGQPPAAEMNQRAPETPVTGTAPRKPRAARTEASGAAQRATPTVSQSEIDAARASGKVWVNTETGVYHKGGRWYGATKQGKFMTEQEAMRSGYRASKAKER